MANEQLANMRRELIDALASVDWIGQEPDEIGSALLSGPLAPLLEAQGERASTEAAEADNAGESSSYCIEGWHGQCGSCGCDCHDDPAAVADNTGEVRHDHDPEVEGCNPATCPAYAERTARPISYVASLAHHCPFGQECPPARPAVSPGGTEELRAAIAAWLSAVLNNYEEWELLILADALLAGPLAPLLAAQQAVERVEALIDPACGMALNLHGDRMFDEDDIRRALDAP